ncbi:hypothetical protein DM059_37075 [Klebsiella pneumoniae]|nr:hypothetical protein DM059_37075 [Klebsiella pneumoniae]
MNFLSTLHFLILRLSNFFEIKAKNQQALMQPSEISEHCFFCFFHKHAKNVYISTSLSCPLSVKCC